MPLCDKETGFVLLCDLLKKKQRNKIVTLKDITIVGNA